MTIIDPNRTDPAPLPAGTRGAPPARPLDQVELTRVGDAGRRRRRGPQIPRWIRRLAGPVLIIAIWQLVAEAGYLDPRTLAAPSTVLSTGLDLNRSGELQEHLWVSLQRVVIGVAVGVALAVVSGLFRIGEDLVDPTIQVLRATPVVAITPLIILWLGIGEAPKVAMIAIGVTFPVYINTYAAIRGVDSKLAETATTFGVDRLGFIKDVMIPGAVPGFLVGLRFSLAIAWLILVFSEQINASSGIGYLMNEARAFFRTDIIVVGLVIYGVLGLLSDAIVRFLERRLLSWRRGFEGT
jgi:sulfonate transport system permease protein